MFFKVKLFFLSFFDREGLNIDRQVDKKMLLLILSRLELALTTLRVIGESKA